MTSLTPFLAKECVIGTGGPWGAVALSKRFEDFIHQQFRTLAPELLTPKYLTSAVKGFNSNIKVSFNPCDKTCEDMMPIPIPGAPDTPKVNLEAGYLSLHK